jgi:UDP-N-acetylmuramoyl-tripeptide--D-alanyl-D-alanine ligase
MNHAGEIRTLVGIAEPDIRVWTNVGEAHVGFFASVDAIADAKSEILERASPATVLVANADDARISARIGSFAGRVVTFGIDADSDVRARQVVDRGIDGTTAQVTTPRGTVDMAPPLVGRANLANVLAATAVAIELDVPLPVIAERARGLRPAPHRGDVFRLRDGITVIDDSYNANPTATRGALEVLAATPGAVRRVAVLGEMLELGDHAVALHQDVGRAAAASLVDLLVAVGGEPAAALAAAAVDAGLPRAQVRHVATSDEAADAAAALVRPGDLVLIKGSRGIRTDRVVDRLKAERG